MITDTPAAAVTTARTLQPVTPMPVDAGTVSFGWPVALIALLGIAALVLSKRKRKAGRWIQVLETQSLGPKRSLVVAQLGTETVLLATSEAGITLLKSGLQRAEVEAASVYAPKLDAQFEDLLSESLEDQELRQKLAAGQQARVS